VIQGNTKSYDGATQVRATFYCQVLDLPSGYYDLNGGLYDENGHLVSLMFGCSHHDTSGHLDWTMTGSIFFTPPAGSHTYAIKAYRSPGSPVSPGAIIAADVLGGPDFAPAYLLIDTL
jgi:hypothetical protein